MKYKKQPALACPIDGKPMHGHAREGVGKRNGMMEEVIARRLITGEGDLSAAVKKKHGLMFCVFER